MPPHWSYRCGEDSNSGPLCICSKVLTQLLPKHCCCGTLGSLSLHCLQLSRCVSIHSWNLFFWGSSRLNARHTPCHFTAPPAPENTLDLSTRQNMPKWCTPGCQQRTETKRPKCQDPLGHSQVRRCPVLSVKAELSSSLFWGHSSYTFISGTRSPFGEGLKSGQS